MTVTRSFLLVLSFVGVLMCGFTAVGCSSRPMMTPQEQQANRERQSIERPARPIDDETTFSDRLGQIGVVVLVVGIAIAGIIVPLLLI